jgi:hypothetical protein
MARFFLAIAVVGAFAVIPHAVEAQKAAPQKKDAFPTSNPVYVKIIVPGDQAVRDKNPPVVESWIAEHLKKSGQSKYTAATAWIPVIVTGDKFEFPTHVWSGNIGQMAICPVSAEITERANGRIKVFFNGWAPDPDHGVTVSLTDEPGSRAIAAVEKIETKLGLPYVAVLIGPPPEKPAAPK